jgi:hypothetical protein
MSEHGDDLKAKEPVVLDAEGHVLHDPLRDETFHRRPEFRAVTFRSVGLVPKILLGGAFIALLLLGLTVAGVALGVIFVGFLVRTIFKPRRR